MISIAFFGSNLFSEYVLRSLYKLNTNADVINISAVITNVSKEFGRKRIIKDNHVTSFCKEKGLVLYQIDKLKEIQDLNFDMGIVASYGKIIPAWLLGKPKYGFINFHASLLPKYRGATPIQSIIMNQDISALGISIIKMDEGMDTGDIIYSKAFNIEYEKFINMTYYDLMLSLAEYAAEILLCEKDYLFNPSCWQLSPQDNSRATYCYLKDFDKEKLRINQDDMAVLAHGKIMSANPEPKAFWICEDGNKKNYFNILRSRLVDDESFLTRIKNQRQETYPFLLCHNKLFLNLSYVDDNFVLEVLEIQPFGKKIMSAQDFINGYFRQNNVIQLIS